jgi:hypothetical protein
MRIYACYYDITLKDGTKHQNGNTACWAGINRFYCYVNGECTPSFHFNARKNFLKDDTIFIKRFKEPEISFKEIKLLCKLIDEITPCKLDYKHRRIKYTMVDLGYNNNLILLNFIRYCWYEPYKGFSKLFFETLENNTGDAMQRLTHANKVASEIYHGSTFSPGHSNVHKNLKIRTNAEFLSRSMDSTASFLTLT